MECISFAEILEQGMSLTISDHFPYKVDTMTAETVLVRPFESSIEPIIFSPKKYLIVYGVVEMSRNDNFLHRKLVSTGSV